MIRNKAMNNFSHHKLPENDKDAFLYVFNLQSIIFMDSYFQIIYRKISGLCLTTEKWLFTQQNKSMELRVKS